MKIHQPDYFFVASVMVLTVSGLIILASAGAVLSQDYFDQSYYFLKHQILFGFLPGMAVFFVCQKINYGLWRKFSFAFLILSLIFLGLVFVPKIGYVHGGAKRWLNLGGMSLQPFEFIKLSFLAYLAALLSKSEKSHNLIKESLKPFAVVFGAIALLLYLQPNMSAIIMLVILSAVLYFLAGLDWRYVATSIVLAVSGFYVLIKLTPYRLARLTVFLHPEIDPQGIGYQANQALLAIGSGGLFGLGLGHSIQKWRYLPEVIGDSVFAILAEELGLVGAGAIIVFFLVLAWRGYRIAQAAPDRFGMLLAGGISSWLFFQAVINIGAISGILPITGIPLPLISYGGSALVAALAGAGILTNISKHTR